MSNPAIVAHFGLIFVVFNMLVLSAAFMVWMERKVCAYIQDRVGPNRVGYEGALQPFADVIKLLFKEELRPQGRRRAALRHRAGHLDDARRLPRSRLCRSAPKRRSSACSTSRCRSQVTDVNVAVLVIFAITSMGVYGIVLAGWSSNSKYSLLGGLRSSAQMISYELSYGPGAGRGDHAGGFAVAARHRDAASRAPGSAFIPKLVHLPAAARVPHLHDRRRRGDQPRAVRFPGGGAGAGRRLSHRVQLDELRDVLPRRVREHGHRLGGRDEPVSSAAGSGRSCPTGSAGSGSCVKVFLLLFFYVWMRWTLPRYRYDQLMEFGWKWLLPAAVLNLFVTAALVLWIG